MIGLYVLDRACGQCCVFRILVVGSGHIVIGLYELDMWSVLCVPYLGWWDLLYSDTTVRTGHVVSVVCSVSLGGRI